MKKRDRPPTKKSRMEPPKPNPELYNLPFTKDDFHGMPYRPFGTTGLRVSTSASGPGSSGIPGRATGREWMKNRL
jgi:hypothetical protein